MELTEAVERLRATLVLSSGDLVHRGLDLSHAFARQLYFAGAADDGLYGMWASARGKAAARLSLSSSAVALLARSWFGPVPARAVTPASLRLRSLIAPLRLLAGRGGVRPQEAPKGPPILLFAHSLRFARFLAPVAQRLGARCAYLVAAGDAATRQWVAEQGHAARLYHPAPAGLRRSGAVLARHAPGLALLAEEIEAALTNSGARVVLVPEGNAPVDDIVARVGRHHGIAVACLQQGWSPLIHTGFRNMGFAQMLAWGQGFTEALSSFNPGVEFVPVGNMQLPDADSVPGQRSRGAAFFCQGSGSWTTDAHEAVLVDLACRVAKALPDLPVFIRPHPVAPFDRHIREKIAAVPNVHLSDPAHQPLAELLSQVSVGVSIYSSTILECLAAGILPVIFSITSMPRYVPDIAAEGAALDEPDPDTAFRRLVEMLSSPELPRTFAAGMERARARYSAAHGAAAQARIEGALERLLAVPKGGLTDDFPAN
ncbi:MAG TPA: hypothetical protein VFQ69_11150 [Rhizomicrobium sp.]|nr:hypothetical protein [Rhizomicrobium sp.]